jgi:ferritin-like metal-binding protein YciE
MALKVQETLQEKLADYVEDALALEEGIVDNLDSMIRSLDDLELAQMLQRHRLVGRGNAERLKHRLEQLGRGELPIRKRIEGMAVSLVKGVTDAVRSDAPGKVGRDAYIMASTQIAAYELLKRLAANCGDAETAELAETQLASAKEHADEIAGQWDAFYNATVAGWVDDTTSSGDVGRIT